MSLQSLTNLHSRLDNLEGSRDSGTTEIVSFPASIQNRLDQAKALLGQNRPEDALSALQQASVELAKSSPELFMLALACQMGGRTVTIEQTEMNTTAIQNDRYVFGVRYGHDVKTTTNSRVGRRSFTVS